MSVLTLGGRDRDGGPFGTLLMDSMAGGGGAYIDHDGLDGSGDYSIPRPQIANVEANEASGPFLYLFRSFVPDTEGAGAMRGGITTALAVTPHDVDELHTMVVGHGVQVPNSVGQFGGMPGACAFHLLRKSNEDIGELIDANTGMHDLFEAGGNVQRLEFKLGHFGLHHGDVFAYSFRAAAAMAIRSAAIRRASLATSRTASSRGNAPTRFTAWCCATTEASTLKRPTRAGKRSVPNGLVEKRRRQIPRRRRASPRSTPPSIPVNISAACAAPTSGPRRKIGSHAPSGGSGRTAFSPYLTLHTELELREFTCSACGTLLEVEVARKGQEFAGDDRARLTIGVRA